MLRKKMLSLPKLKKKLDIVFSVWVRNQGNRCYTCDAYVEGKNKQAGHFIRRGNMATRWDERNVKIQCFRCNIWLNGNGPEFAARLLKELGQQGFQELITLGRSIKQWTTTELEEMIARYKTSSDAENVIL